MIRVHLTMAQPVKTQVQAVAVVGMLVIALFFSWLLNPPSLSDEDLAAFEHIDPAIMPKEPRPPVAKEETI